MKKRKTNKEGWPVTPALVLLALAVAAYWNSFGVPYVFDDLASISLNSDVQFGASLTDWLWSPRGVLRATFALNRALNGDNVWGYHFVNLVLHILNAFLIYLLAHRIFRRHGSFSAPQIAALLAASIFLVHPVQTESVTYISSRSELLSTFFYTLAVLLFARKAPDRIGFRFSLLIALFFFLGMRAKETVISLPAALLLYDFIFFSHGEIRPVFSRWRFYATFLAGGTAAVAYVFVELQGSIGGAAPGNLSAYDYFLTQLRVIVHYIRMLFLPVNLNFAHDVRPSTSVLEWSVVASGLVLLAIACLAWYLRKRSPVVSFSIFWFFITLAPTSSIVSVLDVIFEHRLYLPLVGVCLSFPLLLIWIQRRSPMLTPARCGAAIVLILAAGTIVRNQVWADEVTLWSDTIAKSPGLARGYRGLAQAYYSRGAYDKAVEASKEGIQKTSGAESTFYSNMGQFYLLLGRYDEALDAFSKATQFHATTGEDARAYYNMGVTHLYKQEFPAAEQAFVKSLELDPNYLSAWDSYISLNLDAGKQQSLRDQMQGMLKNGPNAKAYYGLAKVALLESNYNDAVNFFTQSRPAYGNEKMFLFNYAMALESAGDATGAIDRYNEALRIDPQFMQAHFNLAQIYFDRGRFTAAIPHFEQVLKIDPRNTPAHIQLARIFIQQGQRVLARNHLSAVLNMSPGNAEAAALWPQTL